MRLMRPMGREPVSLHRVFWLHYALPLLALLLGTEALAAWGQLEGLALRAVGATVVLASLLLLAWAGFAGWRAWQAAQAWLAQGGVPLWGRAAQVGVGLGTLLTVLVLVFGLLPQFSHWLGLLLGQDPNGQATLQLAPDGRRARLGGHLGQGDAARVSQALMALRAAKEGANQGANQAANGAYLLELDLAGARWHEARVLADALRQRGLQTRVVGRCDGACSLLFLAGQGRQVMPASASKLGLGLHRFEVPAANPLLHWVARRWSAAQYRALGMPENFVFSALGSPPGQPWVADADELAGAGLAGVPARPLDATLPPRAGAQLAEYHEALISSPAWRVLDQRRPGLIGEAAQRMAQAHAEGADDEAAQVAGQRVIEPLLQALLHEAPFTLHEPYAALLAEQLAAAQAAQSAGPPACRALLAGDTATRRALPAELMTRETAWLLEAAREAPGAPKRRLNPLESEVTRRALGNRAPAVLSAWRSPSASEGCARPLALLAEINRLPPGERRLAMRLMFERP